MEVAWYMQLATLSVTGFLCWVILWKTIPEMNSKHTEIVKDLIAECKSEKEGLRTTFTKEMKAVRDVTQERRKRESDRYHRLEDKIDRLNPGTAGSGEHRIQ